MDRLKDIKLEKRIRHIAEREREKHFIYVLLSGVFFSGRDYRAITYNEQAKKIYERLHDVVETLDIPNRKKVAYVFSSSYYIVFFHILLSDYLIWFQIEPKMNARHKMKLNRKTRNKKKIWKQNWLCSNVSVILLQWKDFNWQRTTNYLQCVCVTYSWNLNVFIISVSWHANQCTICHHHIWTAKGNKQIASSVYDPLDISMWATYVVRFVCTHMNKHLCVINIGWRECVFFLVLHHVILFFIQCTALIST